MKTWFKPKTVALIVSVILLTSFVNFIVWSHPDNEIAIVSHSFIKGPSFIIENDAGTIKAFNGTTGEFSFSGTDAGIIINWAMNNLTDGGLVFFKAGTYTVSSRLESSINGLILQGEGHGTSIMQGVTIIKAADSMGTTGMAYFSGHNLCIKDLFFHGNKQGNPTGTTQVQIVGDDCSVENTCFMHMRGNGVSFNSHAGFMKNVYVEYSTSYGFKLRGQAGTYCLNTYVGCVAYGNDDSGFYLDRAIGDMYIGCESWNDKQHGFELVGAQHNTFTACHVLNCGQTANNTYDAFHLRSYDASTHCTNNSIQAQIWATSTKKHQYGINEADSNQSYTIVSSGTIISDSATASINLQGEHSIISPNIIGFVTENSGLESNCVNGSYISHGLAGTPDIVTLTINGSNYLNSTCFLLQPTVIASNSTDFQIGFYINNNGTITAVATADQRDIFWTAEYEP